MNVKETISARSKNRGFTGLADLFILRQELIPELVELAISDLEHPYPEYASWLIWHISKKKPKLIESFQPLFIDRILVTKNQSVLRNLVNITQMLPLIEYKEGEYLDKLIEFIRDDSNKPALFVYSLYKLIDFTKKYPEIKAEIEEIIKMKQIELKPSHIVSIRNYRLKTKDIRL